MPIGFDVASIVAFWCESCFRLGAYCFDYSGWAESHHYFGDKPISCLKPYTHLTLSPHWRPLGPSLQSYQDGVPPSKLARVPLKKAILKRSQKNPKTSCLGYPSNNLAIGHFIYRGQKRTSASHRFGTCPARIWMSTSPPPTSPRPW